MPSNFGPYQPYTGFNTSSFVNVLWGTGGNNFGQLGNGTTVSYSSPIQIGSLTNWKQISGGYHHISVIGNDGTLWTCGYNNYGQLGNGSTTNGSSVIQIGNLTNWNKVSCSTYITSAIKTDGTLWTWGSNGNGQLGNGTTIHYSSPIQVGALTNWKQISCGEFFNAAIKTDGTLWTWGYNGFGQLGNGTTIQYSSPIQVGSLTNWSQVACGRVNIFATKTDGTLWTCGYNRYGLLGNGTTVNYSSPIQVGSLTNWTQVAVGFYHAAAIKTDGTLWTCGYNVQGQLGNGTQTNYSSPIQVGSLTNWTQVACTSKGMSVLKTDGTLWTWGQNTQGQLGNGFTVSYSSPIQVGSLTNWTQVVDGYNNVLAIQTNNYNQDLGQRYTSKAYLLDVYPNIASQIGNRTSPGLFSWGHDSYGELGIVSVSPVSSPIQVGSLTNWKQVSSCYSGSTLAAINNLGQLWMCGYNKYGQLGNGSTVYYSSPIQVGSLTNWKQVSAGFSHTAAIKTDGTLWTWGNNYGYSVSKTSGQLGNNSQGTYYSSPIQVGALTNWKQVSAGSWYTLAVKTDGTLWGWGWGSMGIFGNNSQGMYYSSPIQVGSLTNWKQVAAGGENIAAVKTDGTLWTCGYSYFGSLGNGTSGISYSSPIQVGSLTNWSQVAGGYGHLTAIKTDGTLWTWGINTVGQLGIVTSISYSSPIQVGSLTNWKQVTAGFQHTAAIKTDGTLWTWGYNSYGELGNVTSISYSSPIQIGSLTNWKHVSGVNYCTFAIADGYI